MTCLRSCIRERSWVHCREIGTQILKKGPENDKGSKRIMGVAVPPCTKILYVCTYTPHEFLRVRCCPQDPHCMTYIFFQSSSWLTLVLQQANFLQPASGIQFRHHDPNMPSASSCFLYVSVSIHRLPCHRKAEAEPLTLWWHNRRWSSPASSSRKTKASSPD
jgi:hypothetical protein